MRISIDRAKSAARKMTETHDKEVEKLYSEFKSLAVENYMATLPHDVIEFSKKYMDYLQTRSTLTVSFSGKHRETIWLSDGISLPYAKDRNLKASISLRKLWKRWCNKKEETKKLKEEIWRTIVALGTTKVIAAKFPEALPFIGKDLPLPIIKDQPVNVSKIRAKLKK